MKFTLSVLFLCVLLGSAVASVTDGSQLIKPDVAGVPDGNPNHLKRISFYKDKHVPVPQNREVGIYYATWGVYGGRDYAPHQVPVERLSHVYIAFGGICGENPVAKYGGTGLKEACADVMSGGKNGSYYLQNLKSLNSGQVSFIDDGWGYFDMDFDGPDGKYVGQLAGMIEWKNRNPNLKVIWSLGGWKYSRPFYEMANSVAGRKRFIASVVAWLSEPVMGFVDGVDIDWEYPGGQGADAGFGDKNSDGKAYVSLLKELRAALDELSQRNLQHYEVSAVIGVGPTMLENFKASGKVINDMLPHLDRLGLMTYDFHGAGDNNVGFNSALDRSAGDTTTLTIKKVIDLLQTEHLVTDFSKISLGLGFYGRSHGNVTASSPNTLIGASSSGAGQGGTIEAGVYSYFDLYENYIGPNGTGINGWQAIYYPQYAAGLLWNRSKQQVISYTPPKGVIAIVEYAKSKGMKGVFAWTVDDDNGLLLEAVHSAYGHTRKAIESRNPKLAFARECSTFKGTIKSGMLFLDSGKLYKAGGSLKNCPNKGVDSEKWQDVTEEYETLGQGFPVEPEVFQPVVVWSASVIYSSAGSVVSHADKLWKNKWWTRGDEPGKSNVWEQIPTPTPPTPPPTPPTPLPTPPPTPPTPTPVDIWSASVIYSSAGSVVSHADKLWKNKWWTRGDEPGKSNVWELGSNESSYA